MQITITAISRKPRVSKKGKPFTSVGLKTVEYGERWLSGFGNESNANWKKGDRIDVELEDTGQYLNFTMPEKEDAGPAANNAATAEIKNILLLKVVPMLEAIHKENMLISEKLNLEDEMPMPDFSEKD